MRIHLDTDLGGDTDDACALAMLLGLPGVEVVGITTVADPGGRRAGYVRHCLELAGRGDVPVAAGAERSLTTGAVAEPVDDPRYWGCAVAPRPSAPGAATDLLRRSIELGATVVAIGPFTNLAQLGGLTGVPVVAVGGWFPFPAGLPAWGPDMDWNVQWDTEAARLLAASADLTLVPMPATLKAHLRAADLPRLRTGGPLARLLAMQGEAHGADWEMPSMGRAHPGLPDDLLNFHYDAVAVAVAAGWSGAVIQETCLWAEMDGELLRFRRTTQGRPTQVLVDLDTDGFRETWLAAVTSFPGAPHRVGVRR